MSTQRGRERSKFSQYFVAIGGKIEWFCLLWGIYARFAKKMADSSQLLLLQTLNWNVDEKCMLKYQWKMHAEISMKEGKEFLNESENWNQFAFVMLILDIGKNN